MEHTLPPWDLSRNSPRHARSLSLVLNLTISRVSPQFHVAQDNFFETTEQGNTYVQWWKQLAGFNTINYTTTSLRDVTTHLRQRLSPAAPIRELEGVTLAVPDHDVTPTPATNFADNDSPAEPVALMRSSRVRRPTTRFLESQDTMQSFFTGSFIPHSIVFSAYYECLHQEYYRIQDELKYSLCYQVEKMFHTTARPWRQRIRVTSNGQCEKSLPITWSVSTRK